MLKVDSKSLNEFDLSSAKFNKVIQNFHIRNRNQPKENISVIQTIAKLGRPTNNISMTEWIHRLKPIVQRVKLAAARMNKLNRKPKASFIKCILPFLNPRSLQELSTTSVYALAAVSSYLRLNRAVKANVTASVNQCQQSIIRSSNTFDSVIWNHLDLARTLLIQIEFITSIQLAGVRR